MIIDEFDDTSRYGDDLVKKKDVSLYSFPRRCAHGKEADIVHTIAIPKT